MASFDPKKLWWKNLQQFQNWAASTDSIATKFKLKTSFNNDSDASCPSDSRTSVNTAHSHMSIIGVIYPSVELFGQGGLKIDMRVPAAYPDEPPRVFLCTCVRHPNVEKNGEICSSKLAQGRSWNKAPLGDVVKLIINLMENPEKGNVVDGEMGSLYDSNIDLYKEKIKKPDNGYAERQIPEKIEEVES